MCIICAQYDAGKLTKLEARRALSEMVNTKTIDKDHAQEVLELTEKESERAQKNP